MTVATDRRAAASEALDRNEFTHVSYDIGDPDRLLFEIPVPSNAVGDVLDTLDAVDVDLEEYTVITSGESAMTETAESLERSYAGDYKPLTSIELRTKARDLSRDTASYATLMIVSAFIATAGLLVNSPAIVVGSMVIAPIIGPSLTASVGTVTADRKMIADSFWMQLYGLALAIGAAALLGALFRFGGVVPSTLDLPSLDLFGVRLAPNALSLVVGVAAGAAAGIGLTTKGPTSIIGVMIAAALIPTAGATGIAIAWGEPNLAIGTAVLLVVTMVAINVAVLGVLLALGYRTRGRTTSSGSLDRSVIATGILALIVVVLTLAVLGGTAQQVTVDRTIQQTVDDTLEEEDYDALTAVSIQTQYSDMSPFTGPRTVTIVVSQDGDASVDAFAIDVASAIEEQTGESVTVRVEPIEYESATGTYPDENAGGEVDVKYT